MKIINLFFKNMPIYKIEDNNRIKRIEEKNLDLERDVQKITESNLEEIFGYKIVSSEFSLLNFRIDTLAFDEENNSFVIIEYKKDRSFSVVDQGFAYLALMLNNKADFILEYNEKTKKNLRRDDIDWTQSKIVFIAQSFTNYQQNAISFRDLPMELWEVKLFDNKTILYSQLISNQAKESIKTVSKNKEMEFVSKEIKVYLLEDHLKNGTDKSVNVFNLLRDKILNIDQNIKEDPQKYYIAYKINNKNFVDIEIQRGGIKIWINLSFGELQDPKGLTRDMRGIGHRGNGQYEINLDNNDGIPYVFGLIEQSYQKNK